MKFQIPSMYHSERNRHTDRQTHTHTHTHTHTDRQAESNMPFQLFQSWGHKNTSYVLYGRVVVMVIPLCDSGPCWVR